MLLTVITLFPAIGALLVAIYPAQKARETYNLALAISIATFVGSLYFFISFVGTVAEPQFGLAEPVAWIPALGVTYQVGLDGISLLLYLLVALVTPLAILSSASHINEKHRSFYSMVLLLETAMLGAFIARDLFLFYIFWEMMLVPMYLIIGVWGGPRKVYASIKFFLFTVAGSLPMLLAIIYVYLQYKSQWAAGQATFHLEWSKLILLELTPTEQLYLFGAFAVGFAVKVPMFPLHTWLPDAHVEAPTSGSIILASLLLKMGGYGFLRFALPLCPFAVHELGPLLLGLSVVGVIYGALVAMVQEDIKSLIAYSSVSHMAMVMVGIFSLTVNGLQGGIFLMLSHGFTTGALFLLVGMVYERRHTRKIEEYGGIAKVMPWYAAAFLVTTLATIGLPGTTGFIGEFLIVLGAFQANPKVAAFAGTGIILGAWYMLRMYRHVFHGEVTNEKNLALQDLSRREIAIFVPFLLFMIFMGLFPSPFLSKTEKTVEQLVSHLELHSDVVHERPPVRRELWVDETSILLGRTATGESDK